MWLVPLLLIAQNAAPNTDHLKENPVYRELVQTGITLPDGKAVLVQKPVMADGLDAKSQMKIMEKLCKSRSKLVQFLRNAPLAAQVIEIDKKTVPGSDTVVRVVNVYFVMYGNRKVISEKLVKDGDDKDDWTDIAEADLTAQKIEKVDPKREAFGFISEDLYKGLEKVRVKGVLRTVWTETAGSLIAAANMDSRFDGHEKLAAQWAPLERVKGGFKAGSFTPYGGAGGYTKITPLEEPNGALFVESHLVFSEPKEWFNGSPIFVSKLRTFIGGEVIAARRKIMAK